MRIVKGIVIFFGTFMLYHIIFSSFFPVDENNVLQAPDWYVYVGMVLSICVAIIATKKKNRNRKPRLISKIKILAQEKIKQAKEKKMYDSLSESEKWKLERESRPCDETLAPHHQRGEAQISQQIVVDHAADAAVKVIFETGQASASILQRKLRIGYVQAAEIINRLEEIGIVGPFDGRNPRKVLISQKTYNKNVKIVDDAFLESTLQGSLPENDVKQIIEDENEWRRTQQGLSPVEYEFRRIDSMDGHSFEYWCADLLRKNNFSNVSVTQGSGDQGVDVLAEKDGIKYAVQCKCYSKDLGNTPVQEVNAGRMIYHCQIGAVMTNRYFTQGAKSAADATGVLLWDREKLQELILQASDRP